MYVTDKMIDTFEGDFLSLKPVSAKFVIFLQFAPR